MEQSVPPRDEQDPGLLFRRTTIREGRVEVVVKALAMKLARVFSMAVDDVESSKGLIL